MAPHLLSIRKLMKRTSRSHLMIVTLVAVLAGGWAAAAAAQEEGTEDLGVFKDWAARRFEEKGKPVCTMYSQPIKSEGDYTKRGETYVFVTHRPAANRTNEVSIKIGYTFKTETPVVVRIGGAEFDLFSEDDFAWAEDSREDERMVRAMRAGATMEVEGVSNHGTKTVDTYSLSGFSAANNKITETCRAR